MHRLARIASIAVALPVLLTACSSGGRAAASTASPSAAVPSTAPSGAPSSPSDSGMPVTGSLLKTALDKHVPAGFRVDKSGVADSGLSFDIETNGPAKSAKHCADLDATSWVDVAGVSGVSYAMTYYLDKHDHALGEEIDAFDSAAHAERALTQLAGFMRKCDSYTDKSAGSGAAAINLVTLPAPSLGPGAVQGIAVSPNLAGRLALVAAQSGPNVITVLYVADSSSMKATSISIVSTIEQNLAQITEA